MGFGNPSLRGLLRLSIVSAAVFVGGCSSINRAISTERHSTWLIPSLPSPDAESFGEPVARVLVAGTPADVGHRLERYFANLQVAVARSRKGGTERLATAYVGECRVGFEPIRRYVTALRVDLSVLHPEHACTQVDLRVPTQCQWTAAPSDWELESVPAGSTSFAGLTAALIRHLRDVPCPAITGRPS